ncbi:alpha/beta hydrolase [Litoribacter alkaliphilus]|uniref:Alpha/beta hydrolase n=1 Tax=Litoribacter ruber TaxID=702568 RepID=A0AAP2CHF3_9BACT|nr:alpha/beta hydrolase-fold protein [Litoribacter alkaliphilus]MBS9524763.1 alpha/beta hydrolase [Litoribacter alkaliphilus]
MKSLLVIILSFISTLGFAQKIAHQKIFSEHLGEARDIWIITPSGYDSGKTYPVLYMHDGQNLWYDSLAYAGTWQLQENLSVLEKEGLELIVVGIANGGEKRMAELSYYYNPDHSSGNGKDYLSFILEEVMPVINSNFNIDKDKVGIMGSSLGGLISIQALAEFPEVFTVAGIFSPAFWFNPKTIEREYLEKISSDTRIYMISGAKEVYGEVDFPKDQVKAESVLTDVLTQSQFKSLIHEDGEHKEWYWAREFNDAIKFLFKWK